jgi:hypothetical protein
MFSFGTSPTRAKKAWSSSTCLLYAYLQKEQTYKNFYLDNNSGSLEVLKMKYESADELLLFLCANKAFLIV